MKANELTIGNWISLEYPQSGVTPARVLDLGKNDALVMLHGYKDCFEVPYQDLYGIPLTREILDKNGFVYEKDYIYYRSRWGEMTSKNYITVGWNSSGEVYCYEVVTTPRVCYGRNTELYVHELQQMMRLCGLDELADNFQVCSKDEALNY